MITISPPHNPNQYANALKARYIAKLRGNRRAKPISYKIPYGQIIQIFWDKIIFIQIEKSMNSLCFNYISEIWRKLNGNQFVISLMFYVIIVCVIQINFTWYVF